MRLRTRAVLLAILCGAPSGAAAATAEVRVTARASGSVELFVNGAAVARSVRDGEAVVARASLVAGARNVVVLRATAGADGAPSVVGELHGAFGRVGTTERWTARRANGSEATDPTGAWARPGDGGGGWSAAAETGAPLPAGFPAGGPARTIWTGARDATVLARLELFVPAGLDADVPQGFGHGTTGGAGGPVVRPTTLAELASALCATQSGGTCTDAAPRVVEISKEFDFVGSEGTKQEPGCYGYTICSDPSRSELLLDRQGQCGAKPMLDVTYDAAAVNPLLVGSNKTLVGVGDGARLRGKGLAIRGGVSNVVVRNVTITDLNPQVVWGGDAIAIDDADRVWIDHDRISLVGRQMLVTGWGKASHVTVSWSELDGRTPYAAHCDGAHYWVSLNLGKADTITLLGNWIHHTSGRGPHAGGYAGVDVLMHLVNNAYEDVTGHALNPTSTTRTPQSRLLAEANHFARVVRPVLLDDAPGLLYAPAADAEDCRDALGRACLANVAAPAASGWPPPLDAAALSGVGAAGAGTFPAAFAAAEVPAAVPHLAGVGHVGPFALPDLRVAASPAALRVDPGASAATTITVTPEEGLSGAIAVTASGVPAGVTAAIAPGAAAGTSTVTFAAAASAAAGASAVTITATGGGVTRNASVTLAVGGAPSAPPVPPSPTPDPDAAPTPVSGGAPGASADPAPRASSCASAGGAEGALLASALLLARAALRRRRSPARQGDGTRQRSTAPCLTRNPKLGPPAAIQGSIGSTRNGSLSFTLHRR